MFELSGLFKDKVVPEEFLIRKYEELEPGTSDWMKIWKSHPGLQSRMLEYAKNKYHWCDVREQRVAFVVCYNAKCLCLEV